MKILHSILHTIEGIISKLVAVSLYIHTHIIYVYINIYNILYIYIYITEIGEHDTQSAQHAQSKEHNAYIVTS